MTYRIETDFIRDEVRRMHTIQGVTDDEANAGRRAYQNREGDGITFVENATGTTWFYFWHEVTDVRFIPEEAS
ncbi:hypothetical protein Ade02nite_21040 [Paractinoplanes deccanensis]|uniref:Uncharacterized protein n=1 Tax=Paractinoplanes deccanensis TaxID=113561 RepID=A0ABQ3Y0D1_9ACTN|nr:hypothetical protein [Actinoplanes deccanensis]GID73463.1 hypothetical protein Ade02nite_21040 [Actinoplanes deccanensis]